MKTLTVVAPVYNEAEVIADFHRELAAVLDGLKARYESKILFVVDRSSDGTLEILRGVASRDARVQILALSSRFGHQNSLLAGLDHCRSDALIMMDSDLQHPVSLIPRMLEEFEKGFDVVRTHRQDPPETGLFKRLSSRMFYRLINALSDVPIQESAADFRLLSRRVVTVFQKRVRERNLFLRGLTGWVGFKSTGIPFTTGARPGGRSKYSLTRLIAFGVEGIVAFSKKPLQAAIYVGFLFAALGFGLAFLTIAQYFYYGSLPPGWATLAILTPTFAGIQLIFLGVIGEYVGAIFDEVKGRPHYIVEEAVNVEEIA